jgi:hypothetical protein
MGQVQQRVLSGAALLALMMPAGAHARKFYHDDPLWQMPEPMNVTSANPRKLSDIYDFFFMTFSKPGEKHLPGRPIPAGGINTLGEVPDSTWYTNRHGRNRMSIEELVRGPGNTTPPSTDGPWTVVAAKSEGVTPGFTIKDSKGNRYQIKFDPPAAPEIGTGADVMGSKFYWAFGYFTPQNYIVYFNPEQLMVGSDTKIVDRRGVERPMRQSDITGVLATVPRDGRGRLRAVASFFLEGKPLGPFRFFGARSDDPNDIVPHEHRRDLRALQVFNAWLNHSDSKSLNSLDTLIEENGKRYIRHHLIDFSAAFGAEAFTAKSPRAGYVYMFDWSDAARNFLTFGLWVPEWARADYDHVEGMGRLEADVFDPAEWRSNYYSPAFRNCLPDDGFWAAKQVMRFTEPEIRAIVATAQYSDKEAVENLIRVLLGRQQKIGRAYFEQVLPLDEFAVREGHLTYEDLGVRYGFHQPTQYNITWSTFDNKSETASPIPNAASGAIPQANSEYLAAHIDGGDGRSVTVYVRSRDREGAVVVGVERTWAGKEAALPQQSRTRTR